MKGKKPLYRIYMGRDDPGYFKRSSHWKPVPIEEADLLTHKEANHEANYLRRLGYRTSVEPVIDKH